MAQLAPKRVVWAVEQLAPKATDDILEIGCGGGHAVSLLSAKCTRGTVTAFDRSALQVAKARALNRATMALGRVQIETLTLEDAPVALGKSFSKVLAINLNAFWTDAAPSLASLQALLRPRSRACLVYEAPSSAALDRLVTVVPRELEANHFSVDDVRRPRGASPPLLAVIARRSK